MFDVTLNEILVSLEILWKGMAGIITAALLIMFLVMLMQKLSKIKKNK